MHDFYHTNIIPLILKTFKIENVIISGLIDENLIDSIFKYDAKFTQINTNDENCIKGNPLDVLSDLENYDAIFISDDSNWYTVYNELKIINKTNDQFPLVFICNNTFPNKRRDSYINPDIIPIDFRHKYTKKLPICYNNEKIIISDGFFHACEENTPKNGVLTAIEDFLKEYSYIGMMKINFIMEISILYPRLQINQKRITSISKNIQSEKIEDINLSDKLIENQLLISYINKYKLHDENLIDLEVELSKKNSIIEGYENKIRTQSNEITLKESQLTSVESNLSLKDSQIKNIESKLVNRDRKIVDLENQLSLANNNLDSLNHEVDVRDIKINNLEAQLEDNTNKSHSLSQEINNKNNIINELTIDFKKRESNYKNEINSLNNKINQKEQDLINNQDKFLESIKTKDNEINSLKKDFAQKENNFNNQIHSNNETIKQKNGQINSQQREINEKTIKISSLEQSHLKQLSKIDNKEYCISCYKEEISNNHLAIKYLKNNILTKKILSPVAYLYLILKSSPKEISLNIKLYQVLKDSKCFDIGFYLNNNEDLIESKWCKYFSPELHYVCNGFSENRLFNKKYFNRNSKKELLDYLLTCGE